MTGNPCPLFSRSFRPCPICGSGAIYDELDQGKVIGLGLSLLIMSIALIIVSILIFNLLNSERSKIGLLKAMGYRRREIARPYFFIRSDIGLPDADPRIFRWLFLQ